MKIRIIYEEVVYANYDSEEQDRTVFKTITVDAKNITISDGNIIVDQGDEIIKIKTAYDSYVRIEVV
jgi:hypothetical protein